MPIVKDYELVLHKAQRTIFNDPSRFRVSVNGRRFGKTYLTINELAIRALQFPRSVSKTSPETVVGVLPTAVQARQIIFNPLVSLVESTALADLLVPNGINKTAMTIQFRGKPKIKIAGANDRNGDGLRGFRFYFAALDETQDINPTAWSEVIRPAMSDTEGSRAVFTGTPKGTRNFLYQLATINSPDWQFFNFPTSANPTIKRSEIEQARTLLPQRVYDQEYNAKFTNFVGQIYTSLDHGNLYEGTPPMLDLVVAGVDFGDLHPAISILGRNTVTSTWYWLEGWSPNIDPMSSNSPVLAEVFKSNLMRLVRKWGAVLTFCDPSRPSDILAIRKFGEAAGYRNAQEAFNKIASGINQTHNAIHQKRLLFCKGLADPVEDAIDGSLAYDLHLSYHYVNKFNVVSEEPADGSFSHICDSTRYAIAYKGGE